MLFPSILCWFFGFLSSSFEDVYCCTVEQLSFVSPAYIRQAEGDVSALKAIDQNLVFQFPSAQAPQYSVPDGRYNNPFSFLRHNTYVRNLIFL